MRKQKSGCILQISSGSAACLLACSICIAGAPPNRCSISANRRGGKGCLSPFFRILLVCALSVGATHASKSAFSIEDNYRLRSVESPSVAPDGRVVFAVKSSNLPKAQQESHLWKIRPGGGEPRQLTFGENGESSADFSRDGKWISFASSRDGDPNLYILPVGGGEARKLTNVSTGAGDPLWSPD